VAYRKRGTRLLSAAGLAMAVALAIQGCTSPAAPGTTNGGGGGSHAATAVTTTEAARAFVLYLAATATATGVEDRAAALSYTTDVARATLSAGYQGEQRFNLHLPVNEVSYGKPVFYLPASSGYPRWFVADVATTCSGPKPPPGTTVAGTPGGIPWTSVIGSRHLMLFKKASPAANWQLASSSVLAPGVSPPALAKDDTGHVPVVPLSDSALLVRPDVTGALQAAVVDDGPASAAATVVASGPLTTGIYQAEHDTLLGLSVPPGDVSQWELAGSNLTRFALRTTDGGALVFYAMYLNTEVEVPALLNRSEPVNPGPPIAVPAYVAPLLGPGKTAPRNSLEAQQLLSFAAVDPPGSPAKIQVIAIGGGPNYAYAS
jgi:hypothetical protein